MKDWEEGKEGLKEEVEKVFAERDRKFLCPVLESIDKVLLLFFSCSFLLFCLVVPSSHFFLLSFFIRSPKRPFTLSQKSLPSRESSLFFSPSLLPVAMLSYFPLSFSLFFFFQNYPPSR